ncbi:glutamate--tRNA ligase family protein [Algoriphagus sp. PAP.12]|uniref:glutamate--tRNA ligase family protein n=1 Tax=Algoriphagus sp. PAP.12 TaxID=2996678 RepID=UPI00227CAD68|nr:glutamate--tRNA ligase family protein [Algoriphagus sp. PAP.12]
MNPTLTRIAPTPSGFLHLGNAYSFLLTKALAEKTGAKILLRIDDLDQERYRPEFVEDIFESLDFLEIPIEKGPKNRKELEEEWSQKFRMDSYESALEQLREKGVLFGCNCSRKKISQMNSSGYYLGHCLGRNLSLDKPEMTWRINSLESDLVNIIQYPDKKVWEVIPQDSSFFIVRKRDGLPSFQLTSVIDDLRFGVDLIVRGQDLYGSSLAQSFLAETLGLPDYQKIQYFHHPILKGPKKKKLSKSDGSTSLQFLRKEGKSLNDVYQLIGDFLGKHIEKFEDFQQLIP